MSNLPLPPEIVCQVIDTADDALIIVDSQLAIRFWNQSAGRLYGTPAEEAIGQTVFNFISPTGLRASAVSEFQTVDELCGPETSKCLLERGPGQDSIWTERSTTRLRIDGNWWTLFVIRNVDVRKRREQKLQLEASTDSLSQLANRRGFQTTLESSLSKPLILAIIDIDQFKSINDEFGHLAGDEAIKFVAGKLKEAFPEAISIGRMGGDEFGLVLEAMKKEEADQIFSDFVNEIAKSESDSSLPDITVSIGVAISAPNSTARDLLSQADRCLYESKSAGRNRATSKTI